MVELLAHGVLLILHSELVVLLAMLLDRIARFSLLLVNGLVFLEVLVIDTVEMINDSLLIKQTCALSGASLQTDPAHCASLELLRGCHESHSRTFLSFRRLA